jgi:hypothetical protein
MQKQNKASNDTRTISQKMAARQQQTRTGD